METNTNLNGTEPRKAGAPAVPSATVEHAAVASPKSGARLRRYLGAGWSFTRHLLEMVLAMIAGMVVLGVAAGLLGEPPAYADSALIEYTLMGVSMSAPMVAWMRYRGHSWADGLEMTAAMLVPMFALVLPVELGVTEFSEHSLMVLSHVAMIGGMAALMLYRFDRYAHGHHA